MLSSRQHEPATPTLACLRCGSDLVVPARSGDASGYVFELRDGGAPVSRPDAFDQWLCRSCALRWPCESVADGAAADATLAGPVTPDDALIRHIDGTSSSGMTTPRVARELRAAREARGLSLADAANATGIWERYLEALEADAPLEEFPAPAYARFFLRGYAEYLGFEPYAIVHEFEQDHPVQEEPVVRPGPYVRPKRRGIVGALVFVSILALVALAVVRSQQGKQNETAAPISPTARTVAEGSSGSPSTVTPPPPRVDRVRAVVRVIDRSWVEVVGDGQTLERGVVLEAGVRAVYLADRRMVLTLGNAGGVGLEVNGKPVATGGAGDVVTLAITLRDGEIHTKTL